MRKNDFKVEKVNGTVFGRIKANKLSDIFKTLESRNVQGIYFCRINGYNNEVAEFIRKYYETAVKEGVVIEGGIPNPDEKGLCITTKLWERDFSWIRCLSWKV